MTLAVILLALLAKPQPQPHSVTLSWMDTINPVGTTYNVYRAYGKCPATTPVYTRIAVVDGKSYVDLNVSVGSSYCYAVTASNSSGESSYTPWVDATIPIDKGRK